MYKVSFRRFDLVALSVVGACVAGLYGAAVPDLLRDAPPAAESVSASAASGLVPAAPTARLMTQSPPRAAARVPLIAGEDAPLDVATVQRLYEDLGYGLADVRDDAALVPRLFLAHVPADLKDLRDSEERKSLFLRTTLPLILKVNEDIAADRARLQALIATGKKVAALPASDRRWVEAKAREYRMSSPDMRKLLARMDVIPPSLALAQAAEESGWGTSRFARQGNALFGQWTTEGDTGIVPLNRADGKSHVIKAFPSLLAAVESYARNLNSHPAYADFRSYRATLRAQGKPLDGMALASTLLRYSERGEDYVATLHVIMRVNALTALDTAALRSRHDDIEIASLTTPRTTRME